MVSINGPNSVVGFITLHEDWETNYVIIMICIEVEFRGFLLPLHWRHNERDGVPNHWRLYCLLHRLFGRRSKKTCKIRATGLCEGNPPGTSGSPHKGPVTRKCFHSMMLSLSALVPPPRPPSQFGVFGAFPTKPLMSLTWYLVGAFVIGFPDLPSKDTTEHMPTCYAKTSFSRNNYVFITWCVCMVIHCLLRNVYSHIGVLNHSLSLSRAIMPLWTM